MDSAARGPALRYPEESRSHEKKFARSGWRDDDAHERREEQHEREERLDALGEERDGATRLVCNGVAVAGVQARVQIRTRREHREREHQQQRGNREKAVRKRWAWRKRDHGARRCCSRCVKRDSFSTR
mgnify:CR=1 FL=1